MGGSGECDDDTRTTKIDVSAFKKSKYLYRRNETGDWKNASILLKDGEQSLVFYEMDASVPCMVAGLHEATVEVKNTEDSNFDCISMTLRNTTPETHCQEVLQIAVEDASMTMRLVAALKRASFPPGQLWTCSFQDLSMYAMSRLECEKIGSVWKSEVTKTSVLIDSLRLCSLNSLLDPSSNPESFLLLLRLKIFGCTLSMEKVINEFPPPVAREVELLKTNSLKELVDFVNESTASGDILDEITFRDLVEMVKLNLVRPLHVFDEKGRETSIGKARLEGKQLRLQQQKVPEADNNFSWVHISLLYELLLKLVSSEVDTEVKKRCLTEEFCCSFLQLFKSADARERSYVKTITHCMYSRFVSHRGVMRKGMANSFLELVYVPGARHHGIAEILEVFGSIASGFATPIKDEHKGMFHNCLLPLHSVKGSEFYQEQLSFVLLQYTQKDPELVVPLLLSLLKYWPKRNAPKQILFLGEIGEIVSFMQPQHFPAVQEKLTRQLCACISSRHFQVAEYTMGLLNNNYLYSMMFENIATRQSALPKLLYALRSASRCWNSSVKQIGSDIIEFLRSLDLDLYLRCEQFCIDKENRANSPLDSSLLHGVGIDVENGDEKQNNQQGSNDSDVEEEEEEEKPEEEIDEVRVEEGKTTNTSEDTSRKEEMQARHESVIPTIYPVELSPNVHSKQADPVGE